MKRYVAQLIGDDKHGWKTLALTVLAIALVGLLLWAISRWIGLDENGLVARSFGALSSSPWALPAVILIFTGMSFLGAPQFLLMALAVAAFGPVTGFIYSYIGTLVSAAANFQAARLLGAQWLRSRGWDRVNRIADRIGENGFMASMLVRIVPSGPFVVCNMALGLTSTSLLAFMAGTSLGIVPKLAVVTLLGKVIERASVGDLDAIAFLLMAIVLWVGLAFFARWVITRSEMHRSPGTET